MAKAHLVALFLGPLPVKIINNTLGLELDEGEAVLTASYQAHAMKSHPADYARCQPHVSTVLANPLFIGDDFKNEGKIELIGRVPALGGSLLVAVKISITRSGHYQVTSFYPVTEEKIVGRRNKGYLKPARKC